MLPSWCAVQGGKNVGCLRIALLCLKGGLLALSRVKWYGITSSKEEWHAFTLLGVKRAGYLVHRQVATHSSSSTSNVFKNAIANTNTSVSTVRIRIFFIQFTEAYFTWTKIRVSASSWLPGVMPALSLVVELITSKAAVLITSKLNLWGIESLLQDTHRALSCYHPASETTSSLKELRYCRTHVCRFLYLWLHEYLGWGCSPSNHPTLNRFSLHSECDSWWHTGQNCLCVVLKGLALTRWKHVNNRIAISNNCINRRTLKRWLTSMHVI